MCQCDNKITVFEAPRFLGPHLGLSLSKDLLCLEQVFQRQRLACENGLKHRTINPDILFITIDRVAD